MPCCDGGGVGGGGGGGGGGGWVSVVMYRCMVFANVAFLSCFLIGVWVVGSRFYKKRSMLM